MRGDQRNFVFYVALVIVLRHDAALADGDYNGPSLADRVVSTQIGQITYRFPRNYIINNMDGLRLGIDLSSGDGIGAATIDQFERWGGGTRNTPMLLEAEITTGSWSQATSAYRESLKKERPAENLHGLLGYRLSPEGVNYVPSNGEPILISCDSVVWDCDMKFDVDGGNGVRVRFNLSKLPEWPSVELVARNVVERHGSNSK